MALTTGRSKNCAVGCGGAGVELLAIMYRNDLDTWTTNGTGQVTAITPVGSAIAYELVSEDESVEFTENGKQTNNSVVFDQAVEGLWACRNQTDRNIIQEMYANGCGFVVFHKEATGKTWIWGIEPTDPLVKLYAAKLTETISKTGKKLEDSNDTLFKITARNRRQAVEFLPGWAGVPLS